MRKEKHAPDRQTIHRTPRTGGVAPVDRHTRPGQKRLEEPIWTGSQADLDKLRARIHDSFDFDAYTFCFEIGRYLRLNITPACVRRLEKVLAVASGEAIAGLSSGLFSPDEDIRR